MGIRFYCPNGHKLNVKEFQAGRKGICPYCGEKIQIPTESTRRSSERSKKGASPPQGPATVAPSGETGSEAPAAVPGPVELPLPATEPYVAGPAPRGPVGDSPAVGPAFNAAPQPLAIPTPDSLRPAPASPAPAGPAAPVPSETSPPEEPQVADPLAAAGNMVWYVRPASGSQFGPAGSDVMRSWIEQGRIGADSLVWQEGWPDWREAAAVFPQLGTGRPERPLGEVTSPQTSITSATVARNRRVKSRRQSKKTQSLVIILLVFTVIILFGVFLWIMFG